MRCVSVMPRAKADFPAQQFRQLPAFAMGGGLRAGKGFALGDLVRRRQLAHRMARQQGALEHARQAIDLALRVAVGGFVHEGP
jgi:hypothetical protein